MKLPSYVSLEIYMPKTYKLCIKYISHAFTWHVAGRHDRIASLSASILLASLAFSPKLRCRTHTIWNHNKRSIPTQTPLFVWCHLLSLSCTRSELDCDSCPCRCQSCIQHIKPFSAHLIYTNEKVHEWEQQRVLGEERERKRRKLYMNIKWKWIYKMGCITNNSYNNNASNNKPIIIFDDTFLNVILLSLSISRTYAFVQMPTENCAHICTRIVRAKS